MDSLQISYTNANTGLCLGAQPDCKYIHEKKQTQISCVFVINTKDVEEIKKRQPIEICAVLCGSKDMSEERIQNFNRGVKKIMKNISKDDIFHLIVIGKSTDVLVENEKYDTKESRKLKQEEFFPKIKDNLPHVVNPTQLLDGLIKAYGILNEHGDPKRLKRVILFFDSPMVFKKKPKNLLTQTIIANASKGMSLSTICVGDTFDETTLYDFTYHGRGSYHFCYEDVAIPQKASKFMHGITDLLIGRDCQLHVKCGNGMILSKTLLYTSVDGDTTTLYVNDIHRKNIRKIIVELSVTVKDIKSKVDFLEFTFKFIPADSLTGKTEDIKGKVRFYVTKNTKDLGTKSEHAFLNMGKKMAEYAEIDMYVYREMKKKKIKKAQEKEKGARKTLNKLMGKDSTGHVDKLVRIFFSLKEQLYSKDPPIRIAKSYHATARAIQEDSDFGYMSGKDSDYGSWTDDDDEEEEEGNDDDGFNEDAEEGYGEEDEDEFNEVDDDDDEDDEDGFDVQDDDDDGFDVQDDFGDEFGGITRIDGVKKEETAIVVDVVKLVEEQSQKINDIAEALNLTVGVAGALLKFYKWDNERLYSEFFEDKKKLCKKANVVLTNVPYLQGKKKEMECMICYDDLDGKDMFALPCEHFFCKNCWDLFLSVAIDDGPVCLMTSCPYRGCTKICGEEIVKKLVGKKKYELYNRYLIRSFVDDNPKIKWCPAPDCGKAVWCPDMAMDNVICSCGQKFCFKCQREAHEPCNCERLVKWKLKEKDESETANWLICNTKICPGCKKCIEKNGGCNHMTCGQCKHEFCWICLDDWKSHGSQTGGYYKCNKYKPEDLKKKSKQSVVDKARAELEKYMHYFKRYANHLNSQKLEEEMKKKSEEKMKKLQLKHKYSSWSDVEYIQKGIDQLIECRRTLKYTYIHAFYLDKGGEKNLFEFLQEDLERETERLSGLLEADIEKFNRDQIIASTKSAQTRLKNLLEGVKSGLMAK